MENIPPMGRSIKKELFINVAPQRVFQALTEKKNLERWFLRKTEIDLRLGGDPLRMVTGRVQRGHEDRARTALLPQL